MDDFDGLFEGAAELVGEVIEMLTWGSASSSVSSAATSAPLSAEKITELKTTPFLEGFEAGTKWRVKENEWWDNVTTDDVLVVNVSISTHVIFNRPNGEILSVPNGMIDDFERIE
jgi:hypothetical protein